MIADTAFQTSSPWLSDSSEFPCHLFVLPTKQYDVDVMSLESEIDRVRDQQEALERRSGSSTGNSIASSESSEDSPVDIEGSIPEGLFVCDGDILNILNDSCVSDTISLDTFDLTDSSEPDLGSEITVDLHNAAFYLDHNDIDADSVDREISEYEEGTNSKLWIAMSTAEQLRTVQEISDSITSSLGLREQLEVIRIISPAAEVSPTDSEFVIDLASICDEKLRQIRQLIELHGKTSETSTKTNGNSEKGRKKQTKKQRSQERRAQQKVVKERQRKEYRQMLKEKRSGLFVKEEVMALSRQPIIDDCNIDVLG